MDVREVLRRLRCGEPERRIARDLALSRNTVAGYRRWAERQGLLDGALPDPAQLAALLTPPEGPRAPQAQSCVAPYRAQVLAWREQGVEGQAIYQLLVEQHSFAGSYSAVKRFLRRLEPPGPRATVRLEVDPGQEAQVDFGFAGLLFDRELDRLRRAWAFVMTLSHSRHQVRGVRLRPDGGHLVPAAPGRFRVVGRGAAPRNPR
jgi:transposase